MYHGAPHIDVYGVVHVKIAQKTIGQVRKTLRIKETALPEPQSTLAEKLHFWYVRQKPDKRSEHEHCLPPIVLFWPLPKLRQEKKNPHQWYLACQRENEVISIVPSSMRNVP